MRIIKACVVGLSVAVLAWPLAAAQAQQAAPAQQDDDRKVTGGVTAKGWQGKADAGNRQGLTVNDSRFASEGDGFRLMTGPASMYWSSANVATGDYSVKATFTEAKQSFRHPHPFGVFIGGADLESATPTALYCAAYRNGNYIVRMFSGGKRVDVVGTPKAHDAVKKAATPDTEVVQEVGWNVRGDKIECVVNGVAVWSGTRTDVTGPGKLPSTDGLAGLRASHNSDALVTKFAITK